MMSQQSGVFSDPQMRGESVGTAAVAPQIGRSSGGASIGGSSSYLPLSEDSGKEKVPCASSGPAISMVA